MSEAAGDWIFGKETMLTVVNNAIDPNKFHFDDELRNQQDKLLVLKVNMVGYVGRLYDGQKNLYRPS
jgi:hypothetical protein